MGSKDGKKGKGKATAEEEGAAPAERMKTKEYDELLKPLRMLSWSPFRSG